MLGQKEYRWLLVNIQNSSEFTCQTLNRDIWSNESIKTVIKKSFIFWQVRFSEIFQDENSNRNNIKKYIE